MAGGKLHHFITTKFLKENTISTYTENKKRLTGHIITRQDG